MGPMLRWFVFTITMGLLPFGFSVLLQALRGVPPAQWQNSPELLFFSVMVSAVQMGELFTAFSTGVEIPVFRRKLLSGAFCMFLLGQILAAVLYGVYMDHERNDPGSAFGSRCAVLAHASANASRPSGPAPGPDPHLCERWLDFQSNLYTFSIGLAVVLGSTGTIAEWVRTRREP